MALQGFCVQIKVGFKDCSYTYKYLIHSNYRNIHLTDIHIYKHNTNINIKRQFPGLCQSSSQTEVINTRHICVAQRWLCFYFLVNSQILDKQKSLSFVKYPYLTQSLAAILEYWNTV